MRIRPRLELLPDIGLHPDR